MAALKLTYFIACASDGIGARSAVDIWFVTERFGIMKPLPAGVAAEIDERCFSLLLQECDLDMPLDFLAYFRSRKFGWSRAFVEGGIPDPYVLFYSINNKTSGLVTCRTCRRTFGEGLPRSSHHVS